MKLLGLLLPLSICFTVCLNGGPKEKQNAPELISGGTVSFDFANPEDISRFDLYTSYETNPVFRDGAVYTYLYAEQKIIFKEMAFTNCLVEADIGANVYAGHIDMGIYVACTDPGPSIDEIRGYEVNIEHDENNSKWHLKLHKFNHSWQGISTEVMNMPFWEDEWIHLSVLVKDGMLTSYINKDYDNPIFSYSIGSKNGFVGFRSFMCPAKAKNLQITSPQLSINTDQLSSLINECDALSENDYTPSSWSKMQAVLAQAKAVLASPVNQLAINDAIKDLKEVIAGLLIRKTYEQLQALITECEQITDGENYTQNSYQSFIFCLNRAKQLTQSSSIEDISFNYKMLEYRKNELIRYGG